MITQLQAWTIRNAPVLLAFSTVLILVLTLIPGDKIRAGKLFAYDKLGHAGLFFGWTWNLRALMARTGRGSAVMALAYGVLFGALIEFAQRMLPIMRSAEWVDLVYDGVGAALAVWLYALVARVKKDPF